MLSPVSLALFLGLSSVVDGSGALRSSFVDHGVLMVSSLALPTALIVRGRVLGHAALDASSLARRSLISQ